MDAEFAVTEAVCRTCEPNLCRLVMVCGVIGTCKFRQHAVEKSMIHDVHCLSSTLQNKLPCKTARLPDTLGGRIGEFWWAFGWPEQFRELILGYQSMDEPNGSQSKFQEACKDAL